MKFVDQATISVAAGQGGDGCLSFRRQRNLPKGGPDGGDGGDGGDAILVAHSELHTLVDFRYQSHYQAEHGTAGGSKRCTGGAGKDLLIPVPMGTRVFNQASGVFCGDLTVADERLLVAKGGSRGLGNTRFKTSVNRAPRKITKGQPGESASLQLELMLLADVGLIGAPNAGKSTLISKLSAARPKIASYPFTTTRPYLGVLALGKGQSLVMADIPGLIQGAGHGAGLGLQFLKHAERAELLLQLVSLSPEDGDNPAMAADIVAREMQIFSEKLAQKKRWLVLTKADTLPQDKLKTCVADCLQTLNWHHPHHVISAATGAGLSLLLNDLRLYMQHKMLAEQLS